jgi:hypothetical protein
MTLSGYGTHFFQKTECADPVDNGPKKNSIRMMKASIERKMLPNTRRNYNNDKETVDRKARTT